MKELTAKQNTPQGFINVRMRIMGRLIFLQKKKDDPAQMGMLQQMEEKGAKVDVSDRWVRINMFAKNNFVRIDDIEFNIDVKSEEEIESILADFFRKKYEQAHFKVEVK